MLKKHFWKIFIVTALILLGGSILYSQQVSKQADEGVNIEAHFKGNPESSIKLVEYSDFQCPACAQFYPYVKSLMEEYGESLSFEYKHFPLINIHPLAVPAAKAADAAGQQGKFWEMHDKLFENQAVWSKSANANGFFVQYAEELELDVALFKRHLNSSLISKSIDDSFNEARSLGFTGTPTFVLNGETMKFTTFDEFRDQIVSAVEATGAN